MSLVVGEHRQYLADAVRVDAYRRAIAEVVGPGAVVLDLASGTGILGLLACAAGAARVYAMEQSGLVELARQVAAANGFADRVTVLKGVSRDLVLPERVDAIVCDQIGHFGVEARLVPDLADARDRFLKPGGALVPARVELVVAPIDAPALYQQIDFWTGRPCGFDFSAARLWAANSGYPTEFSRDQLIGRPVSSAAIDTRTMTTAPFECRAALAVARAGTLHGVGGWFSARLSPSATLTNSPIASTRIARRQAFFPIDRPVAVARGDEVRVRMHIVPADLVVTWDVEVWTGAERRAAFRHSTLKGMLLSREELRRMDPRFVPALTPRGRARLSVLELCDGRRALADVEREVYARHADLFRSPGDAGAFVAEVVTGYSRLPE